MTDYGPRSRSRETVPLEYEVCEQEIFTNPGHVSTGVTDVSEHIARYDVEAMEDVVIQNYQALIQAGRIINNPCWYSHTSKESGGGGVTFTHKAAYPSTSDFTRTGQVTANYAFNEGYFSWGLVDKPSLMLDDDLVARSRLVALANLDATPYAFGEDTLELKETFRFLRNPLSGVLNATNTFFVRSRGLGKKERIHAHASAYTDLWLEFQFAASPLFRSICDAVDAYVKGQGVYPARLTARGFAKDDDDKSGTHTHLRSGPKTDVFDWSWAKSVEYHSSILYEVTNPIRDWRFTLGLRMKDLPTTMWQVVPLSFMVDRLVDVSSFSKGAINIGDPRVKILSGMTRLKSAEEKNLRYTSATRPDRTFSGSGDLIVEKSFLYDRKPWKPTFLDTVPKPHWQGLVDEATKVADLCAILYGRLT